MDVEKLTFGFFLGLGIIAYIAVPPPNKQQIVCKCFVCYTHIGWWMLFHYLFLWIGLMFCSFIVAASIIWDMDRRVTALPDLAEGDRIIWIPLLIGAAVGCLLICLGFVVGRTYWAMLAFGFAISFLSHEWVSCSTDTCYIARSVLSVVVSMGVSALTSAMFFRCVGDLVYAIQDHFSISFQCVMSTVCIAWGFDYWQDNPLYYPFAASGVLTVIRALYSYAQQYCKCCYNEVEGTRLLKASS